jgi:hypothetical protein
MPPHLQVGYEVPEGGVVQGVVAVGKDDVHCTCERMVASSPVSMR